MQAIGQVVQALTAARAITTSPSEPVVATAPVPLGPALTFLEEQGKKIFGTHFQLAAEDRPLLEKLVWYGLGDAGQAARHGLSLRKGLLLTGPVGCGKTSLMTLLRLLLPPGQRFRVRSCREVSFAFHREGFGVIGRYSQPPVAYPARQGPVWCFDDLGAEQTVRHFGNTCNVLGEILLSRYDLFVAHGLHTHATSNLTSTELGQVYGERVRSRMREMFNLVSFKINARDKRT